MKLDLAKIMQRANAEYAELKAKQYGLDLSYTAPEAMPKIRSDQVKALAKALVDAINEEGK